ncbi:hypothetical protein P3W53_00900 [Pseudomonas denitrificans (nom. rej.)]|nr:hypothetical protein [Pseudomonas denitrificans (nom. rej.)]
MRLYVPLGMTIGIIVSIFFYMAVISFWDTSHEFTPAGFNSFVKDILGPIASGFGGAIAGALASFKFQQDESRKKELQLEIKNYNRAVHILAGKLNILASYKESMIAPYENDLLRFCTMPQVASGDKDYGSEASALLTQILLNIDEADTLAKVTEAEAFYISVIDACRLRNTLVEQHRENSEKNNPGQSRNITLANLSKIQGTNSLLRLYRLSEQLIELVDETLSMFEKVIDKFERRCIPKIRDQGIKVLSLSGADERIFKKTIPPHFNSADELEAAIVQQLILSERTESDWKPKTGYQSE